MKLYIFLILMFSFSAVLSGDKKACKNLHQVNLNKILQEGYTQNTNAATIENQNQEIKISTVKKETLLSYFKAALCVGIGFGVGTFVCIVYILNKLHIISDLLLLQQQFNNLQLQLDKDQEAFNKEQLAFNKNQLEIDHIFKDYLNSRWF